MRTGITLGYLLSNIPIYSSKEICVINACPEISDGISLGDLSELSIDAHNFFGGNLIQAAVGGARCLEPELMRPQFND
jgi:hypothetical protein